MSFLTIAGNVVEVQVSGATQQEPTAVGETARSFTGVIRSGLRAEKRAWQFTLIPMTKTALEALRTAWGLAVPQTVAGDVIGSSISAIVHIGQESFIQNGTDFLTVATITLTEV